MLIIPGVRAEMTFYKGLLDKLGLQFDALQMGKYKGAAEPLTRKRNEQAAARESRSAGRRLSTTTWWPSIAADRHLKDYQVKTLVDQGLFTAADAKKAGLIDDVLYADQSQDAIKKAAQGRKTSNRQPRLQEEEDRHRLLRHLGGMMKLMELFMGEKPVGRRGQEAENRRGLRRRPDHGGQERQRPVRQLGDRLDHDRRGPAEGRRRRQGRRPSCCGSTAPAARPRPAT